MNPSERVYISLGANLGDRQAYLREACERQAPHARVLKASKIYRTPPWGYHQQPEFLNQVIEIETHLTPPALLNELKKIEKDLGRVESFRFGPRCIDMDILFYGDLTYLSENLVIPHPVLAERAFVLVPLQEIAPQLMHPQLHLTITDLLERVDSQAIREFQEDQEPDEAL